MAITISGNGIVEANLADNAVTLAKMAGGTDGEILTYDASGNPVAVSVGTDGQVLTSTGAGSPPAFETAAGGKVLQVVSADYSTATNITGTTYTDTGLSLSITPSATTSKILVVISQQAVFGTGSANNIDGYLQLLRGSTSISDRQRSWRADGIVAQVGSTVSFTYLDSPSTTSATTYKTQARLTTGGDGRTLYLQNDGVSTITLMEIGA